MVQRYSVSVSDELAEKIEKYKKRISVSKVFQEAIEERVRKEEEFERRIKEDEELEQVIERLRKEKEQTKKDWFDYGRREGFEIAKHLSYHDLMEILELIPRKSSPLMMKKSKKTFKWDNIKKRIGTEGKFGMMFNTENDPFTDKELEIMTDPDNSEYLSDEGCQCVWGWMQGVKDFWDQVKDKI